MTVTDAAARVVVIGETLIDLVHRADGAVVTAPGGSPANVALTLGRLGRASRLVTRLGDDAHGALLREWLSDSGVTTDADRAERTATAVAHLDATGSASYAFDLQWSLERSDLGAVDLVHTGSIGALLPPGGDAVSQLVARASRHALVTFDPNIRPALLGRPDDVRERVASYLAVADVVKASEEDLAWLYPGVAPGVVAARWLGTGAAVVVVTRGGDGSLAFTEEGVLEVPAVRTAVIDTVGAGDTFMGALIDGLIGAGYVGSAHRARLRGIPHPELDAILRRSAAAAAITASRPGADPPWSAELDSTSHSRLSGATATKG